MSKLHYLKTLPQFYRDVESGLKKFEVRKNDRDFQVGDIVYLEEWDNITHRYSGDVIGVKITYILDNEEYCKQGYIVFCFEELFRIRHFPK